jgi:hypothetical protein
MSRIDDLPPDRRAVLQLLLKQGKVYDDLASLLRIDPSAVRERARDGVDRLGPAGGAGVSAADRAEIADFLLGQQSASQRASTRRLLETSAPARAWARVISSELRGAGLGSDALPDIPSERAEVNEAFDALEARRQARVRQASSSRLGGVVLLIAVGLAIAFVIVFLVSSGGDDNGATTSTPSVASTPTGTTSSGTSTTPKVLGQINLNAPSGSSSKGLAAVTLVQQGKVLDIVFQGQQLPANNTGDVYALWLTGSGAPRRLGFPPRVKANGRLKFAGPLPGGVDVTKYTTMELTRETTSNPKTPGPVVLTGSLRSGG